MGPKVKNKIRNILTAILPGIVVAALIFAANIYYDFDLGRIITWDAQEFKDTVYLGALEFAENAGFVSWINMPVSATSGIYGYVAKIDSQNVLTVYSEADGSGGVKNLRVGIATTTPLATLDVNGDLILSGSNRYINFGFATSSAGYGFRDLSGVIQVKHQGGDWKEILTQYARTATKVVCATDTLDKSNCDYLCDGTDDQTEINQAIQSISSTGGLIQLMEGTYNLTGPVTVTSSNIAIVGSGKATILKRFWNSASDEGVITVGDGTNTYEGILIAQLQIDGNKGSYASSTNIGIYFKEKISKSQIKGNWIFNNGGIGVALSYSDYNIIVDNNIQSNNYYGIILSTSNYNLVSGNTSQLNPWGPGITLSASSYNTITDNTVRGNGGYGGAILINNFSSNNTITSNEIVDNVLNGIMLWFGSNGNVISGNKIHNNGGSGAYDGIRIEDGDFNLISSNDITDTEGTGYPINIATSTCDNNYLVGNRFSYPSGYNKIQDLGTNTIYGSQLAGPSGADLILKPLGNVGIGTSTPASKLTVIGTDTTEGQFRVGYDASNYLKLAVSSDGSVTFTPVGTSPKITFASNVIVDTDKTLKISGGTSFPSSPTEGEMFFRTDLKQLYVYENSKWQADRTVATIIVAATDSQNKEKADYVCSGDSCEDEINAALNALPSTGGVVYLLEGTYIMATSTYSDCSIKMATSTALIGAGAATVLKLRDSFDADLNIICNSDFTNGNSYILISNLTLFGNMANNPVKYHRGIYFQKAVNSRIENVWVRNFRYSGIQFGTGSNNNFILGNTIISNEGTGIFIYGSSYNTISGNLVQGNYYGIGIWLYGSSRNTVTGNTIQDNGGDGMWIEVADENVVTGNNIIGNSYHGIHFSYGSERNVISGNKIHNNGGSGSYSGIFFESGSASYNSYNLISSNDITDTAGTGYAIDIADSNNTNNYLVGNHYSGTGASSIRDLGTNTIYGGQLFGDAASANLILKPLGNVGIGTTTPSSLLTVGSTGGFQVDSNGNLIKIRGVTYSWPSSQGAANTYLKNDGSGNLSWATIAGGVGGTGATNSVAFWISPDTLSYDSNFVWQTSTQRLGIGTTEPSAKLTVAGDTRIGAFDTTSWGLSGYSYRRKILVSNPGGELTDYQVLVTLDTASLISAGKMQTDCDDIRFTDSDGATLLNYWFETEKCNLPKTEIWVKVPLIPATSTKTIYVYYGNPSANSGSDGEATFALFDDFDDEVVNTDKWNTNGSPTETGTVLILNGSTDDSVQSKSSFSQGEYMMRCKMRMLDADSDGLAIMWSDDDFDWDNGDGGAVAGTDWPPEDVFSVDRYGSPGRVSLGFSLDTNFHIFDVHQLSSTTIKVRIDDGMFISRTGEPGIAEHVWLVSWEDTPSADGEFDWVFVRKYVEPEPITSIRYEQDSSQIENTLYIDSVSGNVGIDTSIPNNALSVAGSADFLGNVGIGTTNPREKLTIGDSGNILIESGSFISPFGGFGNYQNFLTWSEAFDADEFWGTSDVLVTPDAITSPRGDSSADKLTSSSTNGYIEQSRNLYFYLYYGLGKEELTGLTFTFSVWLKADSAVTSKLEIRSVTPTVAASQTFSLTNSWQRFSVTGTFGEESTTTIVVRIYPVENGTGSIYAWGAQLELGSRTGPYIVTDWYEVYPGNTGLVAPSAAIGISSEANFASLASGWRAIASGWSSVALGWASGAEGDESIAIGNPARAYGVGSIAMGNLIAAVGELSHVIGVGTGWDITGMLSNYIPGSLMVGFYSNIPTLFVGPSEGTGTTGNVGIGTMTPYGKLSVSGDFVVGDYLVDYTTSSVDFDFDSFSSTTVSLGTCELSDPIYLPFTFNFFGINYTKLQISSQGFLTFTGDSNGCDVWRTFPYRGIPNGVIAGYWGELDISTGGTITYGTIGESPNRVFIVEFNNVENRGGEPVTFQIKLFEESNNIQIHCLSCTTEYEEYPFTQGIENTAGTNGAWVSGRVDQPFSLTEDAVQFTPMVLSYPKLFVNAPSPDISTGKPVSATFTPEFGRLSVITDSLYAPEGHDWNDDDYAVGIPDTGSSYTLTIDLGRVYSGINRVKIQADDDVYKVEYSLDGNSWYTLYDVPAGPGGLTVRDSGIISSVSARYIRVYAVSGDGYYSVSELQVFTTDTSIGLYIDSSGNVGIGTTEPEARLHILSEGTQLRLATSTEKYADFIIDENGNLNIQTAFSATSALAIKAAVVELSQPLSVNVGGDVGIAYNLVFTNTGLAQITSEGPLAIVAGDANHAENLTLTTGGTGDVIVDIHNSSTTIGGFKVLGTDGYVFRISPDGNVGIGTTTPSQKLEIDHGNLRFDQEPAPSAPTVAVNPAAGNLNGTYRYKITFVTADGETEAGNLSDAVSPVNQQVDLTNIPIGSSKVIARKIYRTTANAPWPYVTYYVTTLNDNTTTSYTDNTPDSSLGSPAPYINTTGGIFFTGSTKTGVMSSVLTAFGYNAGSVNAGFNNTFIGVNAGSYNTTGYSNTALGHHALYSNNTGSLNTAVGAFALRANTGGSYNTALGYGTLYSNATGSSNTALGYYALYSNTTGGGNTAVGKHTLFSNVTGYSNTALGNEALFSNTSAINTVAIGYQAGYGVSGTSNQGNVLVGYQAGYGIATSSNYNTLIGYRAGYGISTGAYNIVIGQNVDVPSPTGNQQLNIGNLIYATGIYGGSTVTSTPVTDGKVGIGTTTPETTLQVVGTTTARTILPEADNLYTLGATSLRWANIYAATTTIGDLVFGNEFKITETDASTSPQALIFKNQRGEEILRLDENGNLTIQGDLIFSNLEKEGVLEKFTLTIKKALEKLGLVIENGITKIKEIVTEKLSSNVVVTNQLCLGQTCIDEAKLKELLEKNNVTANSEQSNNGQGTTTIEQGATSTEATSTATTTEPISSQTCIPNWQCTDWQPLENEYCSGENFTQTRTCTDLNNCQTEEGRPVEEQQAIGTKDCSPTATTNP